MWRFAAVLALFVLVSGFAIGPEVRSQVMAPTPTPDPDLVLALGFEEGEGTVARDSSMYGRSGDIGGATWTKEGRFGGALRFDGVNDRVTVLDAIRTALPTVTRTATMTMTASPVPPTATATVMPTVTAIPTVTVTVSPGPTATASPTPIVEVGRVFVVVSGEELIGVFSALSGAEAVAPGGARIWSVPVSYGVAELVR